MRRKNLAMELFAEALGNENDGNYTLALELYENALKEVKKIKFHKSLKEKIEHKIKVLHTVMAYNQNLAFVRHSQSLSFPEP
jgi:hypothetical protein